MKSKTIDAWLVILFLSELAMIVGFGWVYDWRIFVYGFLCAMHGRLILMREQLTTHKEV